jgi:hypothetical protein
MKRDSILLLAWTVSCLMSACTHDYDQFDANGAAGGAGGTGGTAGAGGGGNTGGTGGNTGGTAGATGGAGGLDAGTDAPDDVAADAPGDVAADAPEDVAADAPEDVAADAPEDVAADAPEDVAADAPEDVAADAPEDVAADTPEDVAADVPGDVAADAPEDASFDAAVPCTEPGALTWSQNGHCYFRLQGQPKDWPTQRDACVAAGAHLVTITSQEENDFVRQLVSGQDRWIGLRRPQAGEPFSWVTGELVSYTAWDAGEPNETGEACARLRANTNPQTWADRPCNQTFGAICERP